MYGIEKPWEELHHISYFLSKHDHLECEDFREILSKKIGSPVVLLSSPSQMAEGNMANLSPMIPINISHDPGKIENIYIGEDCSPNEIKEYTDIFKEFHDFFALSYEDMSGIDPCIVEHEIKTYLDEKLVQQHLWVMNSRKVPTIKAEIEKLLKVGFIYLIPLMEWVSNIFPVDNK